MFDCWTKGLFTHCWAAAPNPRQQEQIRSQYSIPAVREVDTQCCGTIFCLLAIRLGVLLLVGGCEEHVEAVEELLGLFCLTNLCSWLQAESISARDSFFSVEEGGAPRPFGVLDHIATGIIWTLAGRGLF
jgi:hypothetical protein